MTDLYTSPGKITLYTTTAGLYAFRALTGALFSWKGNVPFGIEILPARMAFWIAHKWPAMSKDQL